MNDYAVFLLQGVIIVELLKTHASPKRVLSFQETECVFLWVSLSYLGTIVVVSHDRMFLDEVATDILHLHSKKVDTYRGNYTEYFHTMTEKLKNQQREYESQMEYRKHIQEFIDKFR